MGKVKLNLVSGAVIEKPLINAFVANNTSYVVLDNEMNGSMGLPIILVSKIANDKLTKIVDQNEWNVVKEFLKNIIAGGHIEFISIPSEMAAEDIYYTQLTLPVSSFDALKSAYKVPEQAEDTSVGVMDLNLENPNSEVPNVGVNPEVNNITPPVENVSPVEESAPVVENPTPAPEPTPEVNMNIVEPMQTPVEPTIGAPEIAPVVNETVEAPASEPASSTTPLIDINSTMPSFNEPTPEAPSVPVAEAPVQPAYEPEITPTPIIDNPVAQEATPVVNNPSVDMFKDQKEAFMQACENMFDALVQKFEKELENRK